MPRRSPFARFPRLGDPSEPSLAPQTAEPIPPTLHQTLPRAAPEPPRSTSVGRTEVLRGGSGGAPVGLRYERAVGAAASFVPDGEPPQGQLAWILPTRDAGAPAA